MIEISFRQAGRSFFGREIFRKINFSVRSGMTAAVTGPNGSGKSTLLRLAAGLLRPSSGRVDVVEDGRPLALTAYRRRIAMVTPELSMYQRLTAAENLRFFLGLRGRAPDAAEEKELFSRVGLAGLERSGTLVGDFSTGLRQRLKIAVLLGSGADVWLLDEPGANLDDRGRAMVLAEAGRAARTGKIVLWATNDRREEAQADEILALPGH